MTDKLYSGHLSMADTILKKGWNHSQSLMGKPHYSGQMKQTPLSSGNNFEELIVVYLYIADTYYLSRAIIKFQCFCTIKKLKEDVE